MQSGGPKYSDGVLLYGAKHFMGNTVFEEQGYGGAEVTRPEGKDASASHGMNTQGLDWQTA
jgi:hypothetical protein